MYVATARTDRGNMKLNFPVSRHYFSVTTFENDVLNVKTGGGNIRIYDVDRSVCDCIRLEQEIGKETVELVVENYKKSSKKRVNHLLQYADQMRYGKIVREYLGTDE